MLLKARRAGLAVAATALLFVATDCSLMLDTDSLRKGSGQGTVDSGAAEDASSDAALCSATMHEACADCAAINCCAATMACTGDTRCNLALVQLTQCRRDARRASNPSAAIVACNATFVQTGGSLALDLMNCMTTHCQAVCTS
jgi:hypothetical protein